LAAWVSGIQSLQRIVRHTVFVLLLIFSTPLVFASHYPNSPILYRHKAIQGELSLIQKKMVELENQRKSIESDINRQSKLLSELIQRYLKIRFKIRSTIWTDQQSLFHAKRNMIFIDHMTTQIKSTENSLLAQQRRLATINQKVHQRHQRLAKIQRELAKFYDLELTEWQNLQRQLQQQIVKLQKLNLTKDSFIIQTGNEYFFKVPFTVKQIFHHHSDLLGKIVFLQSADGLMLIAHNLEHIFVTHNHIFSIDSVVGSSTTNPPQWQLRFKNQIIDPKYYLRKELL